MRIISGKFKGMKLNLPNEQFTRPLRDLVKESIFNILEHSNILKLNIKGSKVLDLFSGSGSFGLECFSRGAKSVDFVENQADTLIVLKKNIERLNAKDSCEIIKKDCFNYFDKPKKSLKKYDIIFLDPPYKELRIFKLVEKIKNKEFLNEKGILIVHRHKNDKAKITPQLKIFEERTYGVSKIIIGN